MNIVSEPSLTLLLVLLVVAPVAHMLAQQGPLVLSDSKRLEHHDNSGREAFRASKSLQIRAAPLTLVGNSTSRLGIGKTSFHTATR